MEPLSQELAQRSHPTTKYTYHHPINRRAATYTALHIHQSPLQNTRLSSPHARHYQSSSSAQSHSPRARRLARVCQWSARSLRQGRGDAHFQLHSSAVMLLRSGATSMGSTPRASGPASTTSTAGSVFSGAHRHTCGNRRTMTLRRELVRDDQAGQASSGDDLRTGQFSCPSANSSTHIVKGLVSGHRGVARYSGLTIDDEGSRA